MFYKEIKQLAAHRLLTLLKKECRIYTKYGEESIYRPSYLWTNLQHLNRKIKWYNIETLRDAAWELKNNNEIDILNNLNHIYDIQLGILPKGLTAYKEKTHIWNFLKSWKTIIISAVALSGAIWTIIKAIQTLSELL